jgi:hypothetical protein
MNPSRANPLGSYATAWLSTSLGATALWSSERLSRPSCSTAPAPLRPRFCPGGWGARESGPRLIGCRRADGQSLDDASPENRLGTGPRHYLPDGLRPSASRRADRWAYAVARSSLSGVKKERIQKLIHTHGAPVPTDGPGGTDGIATARDRPRRHDRPGDAPPSGSKRRANPAAGVPTGIRHAPAPPVHATSASLHPSYQRGIRAPRAGTVSRRGVLEWAESGSGAATGRASVPPCRSFGGREPRAPGAGNARRGAVGCGL